MRRTLRICRNAWTRFGNYPDRPLPVLPLSDDGSKEQDCRFSTLQGSAGSVFSCEAGTIAFVKRTRSQPRSRGCSRGLGYDPNKQKLRLPASPETAVSSLCGNKDTACQVAHNRLYELWTIRFFLRMAFAPLLPFAFLVVTRSYKRWTYVPVVVLHKAFLLCCR